MHEKELFQATQHAQTALSILFEGAPIEFMAMAVGAYFGVVMAHVKADMTTENSMVQMFRDGARLGKEAHERRVVITEALH